MLIDLTLLEWNINGFLLLYVHGREHDFFSGATVNLLLACGT